MKQYLGSSFVKFLLSTVGMVCTMGCFKSYKLLKNEAPQGMTVSIDQDVVEKVLISSHIYDQWQKKVSFDVLYLSEELLSLYSSLYALRRGFTDDAMQSFLQNQLQDGHKWATFYVLIEAGDSDNSLLSDADAYWTLYIKTTTGQKIRPTTIKKIELTPEIRSFFGDAYSKFKVPFLVKFPVLHPIKENEFVIVVSSPTIYKELEFNSQPKYNQHVCVKERICTSKNKKSTSRRKREDYYWV